MAKELGITFYWSMIDLQLLSKNDRDDQEQQTEWSHEAQNNSYKKL